MTYSYDRRAATKKFPLTPEQKKVLISLLDTHIDLLEADDARDNVKMRTLENKRDILEDKANDLEVWQAIRIPPRDYGMLVEVGPRYR